MAVFRINNLQPKFNAVSGVDFGYGTTRLIRYGIVDFKTLLKRFLLEFVPGTWSGPWSVSYDFVTPVGTIDGIVQADTRTAYNMNGSESMGNNDGGVTQPEFAQCPYLDGIGDPREDAILLTTWGGQVSVFMSFGQPAIEEADWATATNVWLAFSIVVNSNASFSWVCNPSGTVGDSPSSMSNNFVGIDWAGGPNLGAFSDRSIALGDGTTEAFFFDSFGPTGLYLQDVQTNNY